MASYSAFSVIVFSLVLVNLASAETYSKPYSPPPPPYQPGAGSQKVSSGSYLPPKALYSKSQSYPDHDSYEYQNGGYKQPYGPSSTYVTSPSSRVSVNLDADELDRSFHVIDTIVVDFAAETLANEDSQQSVLKKQVTQLTILDLPALEEQNVLLNTQLDEMERELVDFEELIQDLKVNLEDLEYLNAENARGIKELQIALVNEEYIDSTQVYDIASLLAAVQNIKTKLIIIAKNQFTVLDNEIQNVFGLFNSTRDLETSRMCETGVTTLTADDRRNTVLFNTDFGGQVPQIEYGISGIKSKFVDEEPSKYPHYGTPYDPKYPQYGKPYDPKYPQYDKPYDPKYPQYDKRYDHKYPQYDKPNDPKYPQYGKPYDPKYPQYDKPYDPKYPQYDKPYDPKYPQYDSSPYSDRDPGTLGDLVVALATPDSITFQLVDAAFKKAETVSLDVTWRACSLGPGTRLAKY